MQPGILDYTLREPLGVTAHIVPWNYPIQLAVRGVAPALAAGNTVVLKPAEDTPITSLKMAEMAREAGPSDGVFNVVTGYGGEAGVALASHPGIDQLTFTGSVPTGVGVIKAAAENVKSVLLELGGKSPNLVFAVADLDEAATWAVKAIIQNAGQTCSAGSRLKLVICGSSGSESELTARTYFGKLLCCQSSSSEPLLAVRFDHLKAQKQVYCVSEIERLKC